MDEDDTRDDLDSFLKKVNDIESVVKAMQSSDSEEVEKAFKMSEKLLKDEKPKGGFSRTVINTNPATVQPPAMPQLPGDAQGSSMRQDEFMRICEEDARQRAENRKKRLATASKYKEAGNAAFKKGDYEAALAEYTHAVEEMRDYEVGYTNRALTLIELGRFEDALADCNFALRIDERNTKAMFVRAKTLAASGRLDEARQQYEAAALVDPKLNNLVRQRVAELVQPGQQPDSGQSDSTSQSADSGSGTCSDQNELSQNANTAIDKPGAGLPKVEDLMNLLVSLNIGSRDELGASGDGKSIAFDRLVQDTFSKRISQLLIDASPARNRCDLELQQNAARKMQRAVDALCLISKLALVQRDAAVCSEVLRATHYCASRWIDVYVVSAMARGSATSLNVSASDLQSSSACVIEHALAYLANCTLLADSAARLSAADLEPNARSFVETYLIRLSSIMQRPSESEADQQAACNRIDAAWPINFQLLVDRALILAARAFRFMQPVANGDAQYAKFVSELIDTLLRILDAFVFRLDDETQVSSADSTNSKSSSGQPLFAIVDGLALNKHALLCLVSAVRHVERDAHALTKLFTSFSQANLVRFRMLCNELITCSDCVTLGNVAVLFQSFARTKQLFRRCLVEVLLRDDATGLKRLLAILADNQKLDVAADWQVCSWSPQLPGSAAESDSKRKQVEQTKANIAILLGKLTQPPPDAAARVNTDAKTKSSSSNANGNSSAASSQSKSTTKLESTSDLRDKAKRKETDASDRETGVIEDELSVRLTEQYRRLHAFEILHGTMHLIR